MEIEILQLLFYLLPALVVGIVAFYFFNLHTQNEEKRRRFLLHKENQKQAFPVRIQAYERMALFLERISPGNLLTRIKPHGDEKEKYGQLLIQTIEQEFEHNLAQQIYLTDGCWNVIKASKNATVNNIHKTMLRDDIHSSQELRENILTSMMNQDAPSTTGLSYLKNEIAQFW